MSTVLEKKTWNVLIYTMYTELSLINPMNQIHWWRSFTWYMYDHPGFRERCFEQIWIHLHDRCTCTWKLWKYYLALIENFRHLSYLRCLIISSLLSLFSFSQPISCFALLGRLNIEQMRKRISLSFTTCFRILL